MAFVVAMLIVSFGTMNYAYNVSKTMRVTEHQRIKGYYAAIAAIRYMEILLSDSTIFTTFPVNKTLKTNYNAFWTSLNLSGSEDVSINIQKSGSTCTITATYSY